MELAAKIMKEVKRYDDGMGCTRQQLVDSIVILVSQQEGTYRLRFRNEELQAALQPFARAAADYEPPKSKTYRDEEHIALRLTAGDLRRARRILLDGTEQ